MEGRHKRLDIDVHRPPEDVTARAQWLADVLVLAADFARGRGARPPNARPLRELAPALAQELAARMPGASVAVRDDGFAIQGSAATMVLCGDDLSIEVAGDVASETRDAFEELTARHEVVSITTGDHLISLGICELDEVDDGGARVHAIATELVALIRR